MQRYTLKPDHISVTPLVVVLHLKEKDILGTIKSLVNNNRAKNKSFKGFMFQRRWSSTVVQILRSDCEKSFSNVLIFCREITGVGLKIYRRFIFLMPNIILKGRDELKYNQVSVLIK